MEKKGGEVVMTLLTESSATNMDWWFRPLKVEWCTMVIMMERSSVAR